MSSFLKIIAMFAFVVSGSVSSEDQLVGNTTEHAWVNNNFPAEWPTPRYRVSFCSDDTLVWNNITNAANPDSGIEKYDAVQLGPDLLQVSWKESPETTNFGIVWKLDFRA